VDIPTPGAEAPEQAAPPPVAPPVVAVVVAHDPGPWFEETMEALAAQDYPNLSILVIDAGSAEPVKARVAAAAPDAFVRRLDENPGFGAAANEVLEVVENASFYLVCHDDIAPAPDVVRTLVEEAYRSNAGIVGPKLVDWHDPRTLLQVGEGADQAGYPVPLVERGELDQQQHDAVRDVFTVPGACTLVRADLYSSIGGFDEGIDYHADDLSLCWRAHVAGARIVVAPDARVRHLEALGARRRVDDRRRLQTRHRLRVVLSSYGPGGLVRTIPKVAVLHLIEAVYSVLVGRRGQAADLVSAWWWNLRRIPDLREARRHVKALRHSSDRDVRELMTPGSARFRQFLRGQIGVGEDRFTGLARGGRGMAGRLRSGTARAALTVWALVALVFVVGSRHLLTRGVPAVGDLVAFTSSPMDLFRSWTSGWRSAGLGSASPAPTAFGILAALGGLLGGSMGLLRTILTVGLLPVGALAAYRLPAPTGSRLAQLATLLVYVANPLPYNALSQGRWGALALYAAVPTMIAVLARASGLDPFGVVDAVGRSRPGSDRLWHRILGLAVVTALVAALVPGAVALPLLIAVAFALGSALTFRTAGSGRMLLAALAGGLLAAALHLPWTLDLVVPGTPLSAITGVDTVQHGSSLAELLRFQIGPMGAGPLGWAILVPGVLPLLIAREERLAWAVRGWTLAVASWGLAWAAERGDLPFALPSPDLLLAPAAAGLALAAAMGVVAFQVDLPGYRFGWRQLASALAALGLAASVIPVLGESIQGDWSMPGGDHRRALRFIDEEGRSEDFRVLWLGQPAVLPVGSWPLADGLAYGTSESGTAHTEDLWAGSDDGVTRLLADAVELARNGETARLGQLLAPMGVRYIVVPARLAPAPFAPDAGQTPEELVAVLESQLDLDSLDVPAGLHVYRNTAAAPMRAVLGDGAEIPTSGGIVGAAEAGLAAADPALPERDGRRTWSGALPDGSVVYLASGHSDGWSLSVDGETAEHLKAFGWANAFVVPEGGQATLRYETSPLRYLVLALQALAWLAALRTLLRARVNPSAEEVQA